MIIVAIYAQVVVEADVLGLAINPVLRSARVVVPEAAVLVVRDVVPSAETAAKRDVEE